MDAQQYRALYRDEHRRHKKEHAVRIAEELEHVRQPHWQDQTRQHPGKADQIHVSARVQRHTCSTHTHARCTCEHIGTTHAAVEQHALLPRTALLLLRTTTAHYYCALPPRTVLIGWQHLSLQRVDRAAKEPSREATIARNQDCDRE